MKRMDNWLHIPMTELEKLPDPETVKELYPYKPNKRLIALLDGKITKASQLPRVKTLDDLKKLMLSVCEPA